jgi:ADP-ribose pyrophosphatase
MARKLFDNYRIKVEAETFEVNGLKREYVRVVQPDFVVVMAISKGRILIERQYRRGIKKYVYELPAGFIEPGEKPTDAARRELTEETGQYPLRITPMFKAYSSPGRISSATYFFLAEGLVRKEKHLDDTESIKTMFVGLKKFEEMVRGNRIEDTATLVAYLHYMKYPVKAARSRRRYRPKMRSRTHGLSLKGKHRATNTED